MNRPILYTSVFLFSQLFLHAALAQSGQQLKPQFPYTVWSQPQQGQQNLYVLPDSLLTKKGFPQQKLRLITPNTSLQIKNKSPLAVYSFPDSLITNPNKNKFFTVRPKGLSLTPDAPNAGSLDPGIFYNPEEVSEPAAIIIKPLHNIDPKMAINPDKQ